MLLLLNLHQTGIYVNQPACLSRLTRVRRCAICESERYSEKMVRRSVFFLPGLHFDEQDPDLLLIRSQSGFADFKGVYGFGPFE